jgi:DEAD/DEAH box helicase domain-containing protein
MTDTYFAELLPALRTRAARATVSRLGFSSPPLRQHLLDVFSSEYGKLGCFLGEPVFEATFGWRQAELTFGHLSGSLLHPSLVDALDAPGGENGKDYRFPRDGHPYTHQMMSWKTLLSPTPQSVVVTSGTGSGKTECFMVPVLSQLAAERANNLDMPLRGVRALFLYPLNALIQSQRERLRAWTTPFGDGLRFCLYNGNTPDQAKAEEQRKAPNEVLDRATLRRSPPPILVTNPTMLEYMLVRAQDAPILQQSQGMLEWIVLDEAHNYVGSQAAELALLLRRVLHAFGTSAGRVRFVATSATIAGSDDRARQELKRFLADLAGVDESRVTVVEGTRQVPDLTSAVDESLAQKGPRELGVIDSADRYQRLSAHPLARRLRSLFVPASSGSGWQPLRVVRDALRHAGRPHEEADALAWLDLLTSAVIAVACLPRHVGWPVGVCRCDLLAQGRYISESRRLALRCGPRGGAATLRLRITGLSAGVLHGLQRNLSGSQPSPKRRWCSTRGPIGQGRR